MKSYFSILILSIIVTTTKCAMVEKWKTYIGSTLFNSFQSMPRNISIKHCLDIFLYRKTLCLKEMINVNFVNKSIVKSIIGSIICCPLFKLVIRTHTRWVFSGAHGMQLNVTFTYFNVGRYKEKIEKYDLDELDEYVEYKEVYALVYTGRRDRMEFFTSFNLMSFASYTFFSVDVKLFIIFSVMNGITSQHDIIHIYGLSRDDLNGWVPRSLLFYKWQSMCYHTYNIFRTKLYPVALRFLQNNDPALVRIYDGPDSLAELIPLKGNYVELSTFQCYLGIKEVGHYNCDRIYEHFTIQIVSIRSKSNSYINLYINDIIGSKTITVSQSKKRHIIYSVYNISTENMYLNISLRNMTFSGPNINNCMFGGVAFIDILHNVNNESFSFQKKTRNEEIKQLCNNLTTSPRKGSFGKISMDYISSESEMFIVLYGYHPSYVGMEVNIMVSAVPCKGLHPCQLVPWQRGMSVFEKLLLIHDSLWYLWHILCLLFYHKTLIVSDAS